MISGDQEQILTYYQQVLQDIRDIKARPWNFITILAVIVGGILSFEVERIAIVKHLLFFGVLVAAVATLFISVQSWNKLRCSRETLDRVYAELGTLKKLRGKPDVDVRKPDNGDRMFLGIGIFAAIFAVVTTALYLF